MNWPSLGWTAADHFANSPRKTIMFDAVAKLFPRFAARADEYEPEHVLPPASAADIAALEQSLGLPLPQSYKDLLIRTRGFWLMDGIVQFGRQHPFFHDFPPL